METTKQEQLHKDMCEHIHNLWVVKNQDYGNSFHDLYEDLGIISAVTQITHKYNRLKNLAKERSKGLLNVTTNESITDTLLDMANYCIMTAMEIELEDNNK